MAEGKPIVRLSLDGLLVRMNPRGYLGGELFDTYRKTIEGARFVREKGANLATFDKIPAILTRLRAAGFDAQMEPDLIRALQKRTAQQWSDDQAVKERIERIDQEIRARMPGKSLFAYQRYGARWLASRYAALLADDMGVGKAIAASEPVLTPTGWRRMADLRVGDQVIGSNGRSTIVLGVYPQGRRKLYRVMLTDGASVRVDGEHLWYVETTSTRFRRTKGFVMTTKQLLRKGLREKSSSGRSVGNLRWFVPVVASVSFRHKRLPLDPYLVGALIANGCLTANTPQHSGGKDQQREIAKVLPDGWTLRCHPNKIEASIIANGDARRVLTRLGLTVTSPERRIPKTYRHASIEQRTGLLQGLLDNDGTISKQGVIEYNTTSPGLAEDVVALVRSLGGIARTSTRIPTYTYKGEQRKGRRDHRIRISLPPGIVPFRIARKLKRVGLVRKYLPAHAVESIEPCGYEDAVCIKVAAKDQLFVTKDFILTHNTLQAIAALPANAPTIVVAPASLKGEWVGEFEKWRPGLEVRILVGRDSFRWPKAGEILVTNYEILPEIHDVLGVSGRRCEGFLAPERCTGCKEELQWTASGVNAVKTGHLPECTGYKEPKRCYGCHPMLRECLPGTVVILDEGHKIKNGTSIRSVRARAVTKGVRVKDGRSWVLTGTPMENDPKDLWYVMDAAGIADECFGNWPEFVKFFKGRVLEHGTYEWGLPDGEVVERIKRGSLRRMKRDVQSQLPERMHQEVVVDVDRKTIAACDAYLKTVGGLDRLASLIEKEKIRFQDMSAIRQALATAKIPALLDILKEYDERGEVVVVYSMHREPIDTVAKLRGWEVIHGDIAPEKRRGIVARFQEGKLKGLGVTIQAGGTGLTLTRAARGIFVDLSFKPTENDQAEDRQVRIGQTRGVIFTILKANHPLDRRVTEILMRKRELIVRSVDASSVADDAPPDEVDQLFKERLRSIQEEIAGGRAVRRMPEGDEEKKALVSLSSLAFDKKDERLASDLLEQALEIGLSNKQWALALDVSKRGRGPSIEHEMERTVTSSAESKVPLATVEQNGKSDLRRLEADEDEDQKLVKNLSNEKKTCDSNEDRRETRGMSNDNTIGLIQGFATAEERLVLFNVIGSIYLDLDTEEDRSRLFKTLDSLRGMTDHERDDVLKKFADLYCVGCGEETPKDKPHDCPAEYDDDDDDDDDEGEEEDPA